MSYHGNSAATTTSNIYLSSTTTTCATVVVESSTTTTIASTEINLTSFDENSPRPPVLGEEHEPAERSQSPTPGLTWSTGGGGFRYSPSFTPRRTSSCQQDAVQCRQDAPLGFEPEGSERATPGSFVELGTPPYLRWAISLASLLEDPDGVSLFKKYLEIEGSTDMLDFWFACEGLKNEVREDANVAQLVRLIHKRYFKASSPLKVNETLKREVHRRVREVSKGEAPPDRKLFDEAQRQVEIFINNTAYPEFLRSETYLQHVRSMQSGSAGGCLTAGSGGSEEESSSSSSSTGKEISASMGLLPTLHEDAELEVLPHHHHHHHGHHKHHGSVHLHHQQLSAHFESSDQAALPLTRDMLMATQKERALELRPKQKTYSRLCSQQASSSPTPSSLPNPYHMTPTLVHPRGAGTAGLNYSSYNPVSRQDSELQSLSSDAHTEDSASVTNSSLDGGSLYRSSRKHHMHSKQMREQMREQIRESANHNRDPHMHHTIIPRTQRIPRENVQPLKPDEFAAILIQKLESVQRELEVQEKFERKLLEGESGGEEMMAGGEVGTPRLLAEAIRERLQVTEKVTVTASPPVHSDDSNQAILDLHVSRVWSDLTPSRSPGLVSPRPRSPEGRRRTANVPAFLPVMGGLPTLQPAPSPMSASLSFPSGATCPVTPHPYQSRLSHGTRHGRKEKDGVSTLSSDSGNVHDYAEGSEHKHQHHYLPKSKSVPDYVEAQKQDMFGASGHESRMFAKELVRKTTGSRKTLTDLTDSGVSVISDTPPCQVPGKDRRVLSWLIQSETQQLTSSAGYSHSDSSSKHRGRSSATAGNSSSNLQRQARGSKKSATGGSGSRSGSVERSASAAASTTSSSWSHGPGQPFIADPSMPPLPSPHTATQLEEARRRLEDVRESKSGSGRQRFPSSSSKTLLSCGPPPLSLPLSPSTEPSGSGQSTLRRHAVGSSSSSTLGRASHSQPSADYTTVMFTFCDEEVPYRTKIHSKHVILRQFKEILPKRGNYRYFFKTECDDVDTRVIHEEVMDDSEVLPLWEGKVMAQVKPVE